MTVEQAQAVIDRCRRRQRELSEALGRLRGQEEAARQQVEGAVAECRRLGLDPDDLEGERERLELEQEEAVAGLAGKVAELDRLVPGGAA